MQSVTLLEGGGAVSLHYRKMLYSARVCVSKIYSSDFPTQSLSLTCMEREVPWVWSGGGCGFVDRQKSLHNKKQTNTIIQYHLYTVQMLYTHSGHSESCDYHSESCESCDYHTVSHVIITQ